MEYPEEKVARIEMKRQDVVEAGWVESAHTKVEEQAAAKEKRIKMEKEAVAEAKHISHLFSTEEGVNGEKPHLIFASSYIFMSGQEPKQAAAEAPLELDRRDEEMSAHIEM